MTDRGDNRMPGQRLRAAEDGASPPASGAAVAADAPPDDRPLPPLPDGGLAATMPDWLRHPDAAGGDGVRATTPDYPPEGVGAATAVPPPAEAIDPTTFLTEDDLPAWLRRLATGRGDAASGGGAVPGPARRVPPAPVPVEATHPRTSRPTPEKSGAPAPAGPVVVAAPAPIVAPPPAVEPRAAALPRAAGEPLGKPSMEAPDRRAGESQSGRRLLPAVAVVAVVVVLLLLVYATAR